MHTNTIYSIASFYRYMDNCLHRPLQELSDKRTKPQIKLSDIYRCVTMIPLLRLRSLLALDQHLRIPRIQKQIGLTKRSIPISDTSLVRLLSAMNTDQQRKILYAHYNKEKTHLRFKLSNGEKIRTAVVDGTTMGGQWYAGLQIVGTSLKYILDLEPYEKRGKELPAARRLLERLITQTNQPKIDMVMGDGLYYSKYHINQLLDADIDVLIKLKSSKRSRPLGKFDFKLDWHIGDIHTNQGIDYNRMCAYTIEAQLGKMKSVNSDLLFARVTETYFKKNKTETFYVICSRTLLPLTDVRELAHQRWSIENGAFKALNAAAATKHVYTKQTAAARALHFVLITGFNLLTAFIHACQKAGCNIFAHAKPTLAYALFSLVEQREGAYPP